MKTAIHLMGQLPEKWAEALAELSEDLGFTAEPGGFAVTCRRGGELAVECDGSTVTITWATPVQFYRALSLIPQPLAPCSIHEKPCFETAGMMFDVSRNAVLKPETLRFFLRKMALMGMNLGMMYTEDTYEVPEQPYFGYKRGRYTYDELKALDDYADMLGIELCPCIQTLGHLNRALHWPALAHLQENSDVILADLEETYAFLEQLIRAAAAPYRSKRIHIGMDEAYGIGLGQHLRKFGYEDPRKIIARHLERVLEITDKYHLKAMMWSDMYFHLDGGDYIGDKMPSQTAIDAVDPRVTLVYWDYYRNKEEVYANVLKKHAMFPVETVFAGGLWTWIGPAPSNTTAITNSLAGLSACKKAGTKLVLATAWGDDGAETNLLAALLGMQLYGEFTYKGGYDESNLAARFRRCCGADAQAFLDLDMFNTVPGMECWYNDPVNACKFLLYQDPVVQLFETDTKGLHMAEHYAGLTQRYARYAAENQEYALLFDFYTALAHALSLKCAWHEKAAEIVRAGDREGAGDLAADVPAMIEAVEALRAAWRQLWDSTNKPYGFEVIDSRLGGVAARLSTAMEKMRAFAEGRAEDIPELSSPVLPFKHRTDGTTGCAYTMAEILSACKIDF